MMIRYVLLLFLFHKVTSLTLSQCEQRHFPKFFGLSDGDSYLTDFDLDTNGDVVIAGYSYSNTLVSTSGNNIVALITKASH